MSIVRIPVALFITALAFIGSIDGHSETTFSPGDPVVFLRDVRAHADQDVRKEMNTNVIGMAQTGARARVEASIQFPHRRGNAVRVRLENSQLTQSVWVYYNDKFPWLKKQDDTPTPLLGFRAPGRIKDRSASRTPAQDLSLVAPPPPIPSIPEPTLYQPRSEFSIIPGASYSRINATDTGTQGKAQILSGLDPMITLGWNQRWSPTLETHLNAMATYYQNDSQQERQISPGSYSLTGLSFGFLSTFSAPAKIGLSFTTEQTSLVRGTSLTGLTIDRIQIINPTVDFGYNYYRYSNLDFSLEGSAGLILPSQYDSYSMQLGRAC